MGVANWSELEWPTMLLLNDRNMTKMSGPQWRPDTSREQAPKKMDDRNSGNTDEDGQWSAEQATEWEMLGMGGREFTTNGADKKDGWGWRTGLNADARAFAIPDQLKSSK